MIGVIAAFLASKGHVFRAAHDRFAERWAQKKVRASNTQGEEGPVACGEEGGPC